jgi:caffeoyl-CoA O-methyltransferase
MMSASTLALTDPLRSYLVEMAVREHPVLARLRDETAKLPEARMQIAPEQGAFMGMLVALLQAQQIVEVGTFTGYSALAMALAQPEGGRITCCDVSVPFTDVARKAWREAGVADRIELRIAPAVETLDLVLAEGRAGTFDLAFVDADKTGYPDYVDQLYPRMTDNGVVLLDNTLRSGRVLDPQTDDDRTLVELNAALATHPRWETVLLPLSDGLTMLRRR